MKTPQRTILFLLSLSVLGLTGCAASKPPPSPHVVMILPADHLLGNCTITPPPAKTTFRKASRDEQVGQLIANDSANIANLGKCNTQWQSLRDWKAAIKQKYQNDKTVTIQE